MAGNAIHWNSLKEKARARGYEYADSYDRVPEKGDQTPYNRWERVVNQPAFLRALFGDTAQEVHYMMVDVRWEEGQVLAFLDSLPLVPIHEGRRVLGHEVQESDGEVSDAGPTG